MSINARRSFRCLAALALLALPGVAATGCSTAKGDLAPGLTTLSQRRSDYNNAAALSVDSNYRAFWADLSRAALLDRPSRLAPEPIAH